MSNIPADLRYAASHEWARLEADGSVTVGISDHAQEALGDVVFVQLPDVGAELTSGDSFGEVESTKSVSDLYAPITAKVIAVNGDLEGNPGLVNSDPYGEGWLVELQADAADLAAALGDLLDADGYRDHATD